MDSVEEIERKHVQAAVAAHWDDGSRVPQPRLEEIIDLVIAQRAEVRDFACAVLASAEPNTRAERVIERIEKHVHELPKWLATLIVEWLQATADQLREFQVLIRGERDVDEKTHSKFAAAAGMPISYKAALDEVEAWRGACAAAFGIVTADPRGSLLGLASAWRDAATRLQDLVRAEHVYERYERGPDGSQGARIGSICSLCERTWGLDEPEIHEDDCALEPISCP